MGGFFQKYPAIGAVLALVVIAVAGTIIVRSQQGSTVVAPDQAYFYSLQSGELFSSSYDNLPPVQAPNGGEGVRAYVYSCATCDVQNQFTAYLETYPAEAKAKLKAAKASKNYNEAGEIMTATRQIAALPESGSEPEWFNAASPKAQSLMNQHRTKCGDAMPIVCDP